MNKKIVISLLAVSVLMIIVSMSVTIYASLEQGETNHYEALYDLPKDNETILYPMELNQRWSDSRLVYTDGVDCYYEGYAQELAYDDGTNIYRMNVPKVVKGAC